MNLVELFQSEQDLKIVQTGEPIFREGDVGDEMFVLVAGSAEILVRGHVVEVAGPGSILGEMSMIDSGAPRAATVIAKTDCQLAVIEPNGFKFLVQESPDFAIHVMRVMANRLRHADKFIGS